MKLYSLSVLTLDDKGEKHFDCFIAVTCAKNRLDFYLQTRLVTQNTKTENKKPNCDDERKTKIHNLFSVFSIRARDFVENCVSPSKEPLSKRITWHCRIYEENNKKERESDEDRSENKRWCLIF